MQKNIKTTKKCMKVAFATFSPWEKNRRSPTNGMVEPMISFFTPRTKRFVLIDQPHPGSDKVIPIIESYDRGKQTGFSRSSILVSWIYPLLILNNTLKTSLTFKVRDFLSVIDWGIRDRGYYDLFIGLESVNALAGVVLKKMGLVSKVVYYVTDFSLHRYKNPLFNKLYLLLDRLAFEHADFVWDISKAIMPARIITGINPQTPKTPIYVPGAVNQKQVNNKPNGKRLPATLVYAGALNKENGPDLAIHAFKKVLKKYPEAKLHIFTDGQDKETQSLRDLTDEFGIHDKVLFHGLISNQFELINDLKQFMIGLAPYRIFPDSSRWWADATKIRLYLAAGLPVITTKVPPIAKELEDEKSGLIVKDNAQQLAQAIISLLKNKKLYGKMKQNAIMHARNNTWDKIYTRTLKKMNIN